MNSNQHIYDIVGAEKAINYIYYQLKEKYPELIFNLVFNKSEEQYEFEVTKETLNNETK